MKLCSTNDKKQITLLLLGIDNAGKTTILKYLLKDKQRSNSVPTIGFSISKTNYHNFRINIYDIGGHANIRDIWEQYYNEAYGVIYVIDCSNKERFQETKTLLHNLITHDNIKRKPLLIFANKVDQNPYYEDCDFIEDLDVEKLVNENQCPTFVKECSALHDPIHSSLKYPINQGFSWLINVIEFHYEMLNNLIASDQNSSNVMQRSSEQLLLTNKGVNWKRILGRNNKTAPEFCVSTNSGNSETPWAYIENSYF